MADVVLAEDLAVRHRASLGTVVEVDFAVAVVSLDAEPGHLAMADGLGLTDDRDVVLDITSGDTGATARALVVVDRHAPAIGLVRIGVVGGIELEGRAFEVMTTRFRVLGIAAVVFTMLGLGRVRRCREMRHAAALGEIVERDFRREISLALVVRPLGERQSAEATGLRDRGLRREIGRAARFVRRGRQQVDDVHAARHTGLRFFDVARVRGVVADRVALTDRDRDHVVADAAARDRPTPRSSRPASRS